MNRRAFLRTAGGAAAVAAMPGPALRNSSVRWSGHAPLRAERLVERWSWAMGQTVHLTLFTESDDRGFEAASAVFRELRRIESRLSVFDEASDVSELNRRAGRTSMKVGDDLATILRAGIDFRRQTAGAFDLAVEPLMRAWGFRAHRAHAPSARELAEAEAAVRHASVSLVGRTARLAASHARIDTGGLAVGYGLDRAVVVLRACGIQSALIEISGDCYGLGTPPGAPAWMVRVVNSVTPASTVRVVPLRDAALATSANSIATRRYGAEVIGHVMDPRAGRPATALAQATVVAETGLAADALSTAMLVSGCVPDGARSTVTIPA